MALANFDHDFGHWLSGFTAGEGSFNIGKNSRGARFCSFRIALHEDDLPILEEIQEQTGVGWVKSYQSPSMKSPASVWCVTSKEDCMALVWLFEEFPLRGKKQRDFEVWAEAVRVHALHRHGEGWEEFDELRLALHECRPQRGRKAWVA